MNNKMKEFSKLDFYKLLVKSIESGINAQKEKPDTFYKNKKVAKRGGGVAGKARKETEKELGRSVITNKNFLQENLKTENEN